MLKAFLLALAIVLAPLIAAAPLRAAQVATEGRQTADNAEVVKVMEGILDKFRNAGVLIRLAPQPNVPTVYQAIVGPPFHDMPYERKKIFAEGLWAYITILDSSGKVEKLDIFEVLTLKKIGDFERTRNTFILY